MLFAERYRIRKFVQSLKIPDSRLCIKFSDRLSVSNCPCFLVCSTCFGHHYAHHQVLKSIIQWLLSVVCGTVVFKLLVCIWNPLYFPTADQVSFKRMELSDQIAFCHNSTDHSLKDLCVLFHIECIYLHYLVHGRLHRDFSLYFVRSGPLKETGGGLM